jgi:hypothetical protein
MEHFDAFEEIFAHIERYMLEHGHVPRALVVSPSLYQWLCDCRKDTPGHTPTAEDLRWLETPHGKVRLIIDERLDPFEILTE